MCVCSCLDSHRTIIEPGCVKIRRQEKGSTRSMSDILLGELNRTVSVTSQITHAASTTAASAVNLVSKRSTAVAAGARTAGSATAAAVSAATHRISNSSVPRRKSTAGTSGDVVVAPASGGAAVAPAAASAEKPRPAGAGGRPPLPPAAKPGEQKAPWWACMVRSSHVYGVIFTRRWHREAAKVHRHAMPFVRGAQRCCPVNHSVARVNVSFCGRLISSAGSVSDIRFRQVASAWFRCDAFMTSLGQVKPPSSSGRPFACPRASLSSARRVVV